MKPVMQLNDSLPKTHKVPINPETGKVWEERFAVLIDLATDYRYGDHDDGAMSAMKREYDALHDECDWREQPYFCEYKLMLGANAALRGYGGKAGDAVEPRKSYGCHPETWAAMTDEERSQFDVFEGGGGAEQAGDEQRGTNEGKAPNDQDQVQNPAKKNSIEEA